jgi:pilus assembly protein CpaE
METSIQTAAPAPVKSRVTALVIPAGALRDATLFALHELTATVAYEHEDASNWSGLCAAMEHAGVEVLVFDLAAAPEADLTRWIAQIKSRMPRVRIIAAYPYDDPARILAALRAGANEFIHSPIGPALEAAFARIPEAHVAATESERRGQVVGFVSAKGGCGATTTACHVAVELKRRSGKGVLLAELDICPGPVGFLMKTQGQYSLNDALDNIARLDANFWSALLAPSRTGVSVLTAATRLMPGDADAERVQRVLRFMRTQHDWAVLDFGRGLNPLLTAAADELDELFVITTIDLPSLHMAKSMLRSLPGRFERIPVHLVLNRAQKAADVSVDEIQKIFGRKVDATLPEDFEALYAAYANGTLLQGDCALGAAFSRMAMALTGETAKVKTKKFLFW